MSHFKLVADISSTCYTTAKIINVLSASLQLFPYFFFSDIKHRFCTIKIFWCRSCF